MDVEPGLLFLGAGWVGLAVVAAVVAHRQRRNWLAWLLLSLLFGPLMSAGVGLMILGGGARGPDWLEPRAQGAVSPGFAAGSEPLFPGRRDEDGWDGGGDGGDGGGSDGA